MHLSGWQWFVVIALIAAAVSQISWWASKALAELKTISGRLYKVIELLESIRNQNFR